MIFDKFILNYWVKDRKLDVFNSISNMYGGFIIILIFGGIIALCSLISPPNVHPVIPILKITCYIDIIYLTIYSLIFLNKKIYRRPLYFWLDFIPVLNVIMVMYNIITNILLGIEKIIRNLIESYAYVDSHSHNQHLKEAIKSTEKMTDHIKNMKKNCKTESDELTLQLLNKSKKMIEVLES